jgi:ABC-type phosphate transport system permease subunit
MSSSVVVINLFAPSGVFLLEFSMRTFLSWLGFACVGMAGVSIVCGAFGLIDPVDTLVFVLTFIGLHVLILWEMEHTPD